LDTLFSLSNESDDTRTTWPHGLSTRGHREILSDLVREKYLVSNLFSLPPIKLGCFYWSMLQFDW